MKLSLTYELGLEELLADISKNRISSVFGFTGIELPDDPLRRFFQNFGEGELGC